MDRPAGVAAVPEHHGDRGADTDLLQGQVRGDVPHAPPVARAVSRAAAAAGLPASALIGIRHGLERGRGGEPVGTALLGAVMAVAALCAAVVFGASVTHLISSPALYGAPFQVYFAPDGG